MQSKDLNLETEPGTPPCLVIERRPGNQVINGFIIADTIQLQLPGTAVLSAIGVPAGLCMLLFWLVIILGI